MGRAIFRGVIASLATLAAFVAAGPASAGALFPDWPDAIICTRTDSAGPAFGAKYSFIHVVNDGTATMAGYAIYRLADPSTFNDYYFQSSGASNGHSSGSFLDLTDCAGKSMAQLQTSGQAIDFAGGQSGVPTGAMMYFNLSACPTGWTRHLQLERSIQPDAPMVLCRKD